MSTLARHVKKGSDKEAIPQNLWNVTMHVGGTLATGDDQGLYVVPFDCRLISATMQLAVNGTTSGATTLSVETLADNTDMTAGLLTLAHDSSVLYDSADINTATWPSTEIRAGAVVTLCIDAIPGGSDSTELTVHLGFVTI